MKTPRFQRVLILALTAVLNCLVATLTCQYRALDFGEESTAGIDNLKERE